MVRKRKINRRDRDRGDIQGEQSLADLTRDSQAVAIEDGMVMVAKLAFGVIREHEIAEHGGALCTAERINMTAHLGALLGLKPEHVERLGERQLYYQNRILARIAEEVGIGLNPKAKEAINEIYNDSHKE